MERVYQSAKKECVRSCVMINRSLQALEGQLAQAQRDVEALQELKQEALADPRAFVRLLESPGRCAGRFPRLQRIETVPMVDVSRYQRRFTRHISHKYDQNLGMMTCRTLYEGKLMRCFATRISDEASGRAAADALECAPGVGGAQHPRKPRISARGGDDRRKQRTYVANAGGMATEDTDAGGRGNVALRISASEFDSGINADSDN